MSNEAVLPAPLGVALDAAELEPSRRLAWAALLDVTPASELGELIAVVPEEDDGVYTLQYTTRLPGYPDWRWNVSLVRLVDQSEPTVLEAELLPGDGALLAPSWVPWSDRLADYEAAQLLEAGEAAEGGDETAEAAGEEAAPKSSKRIRRTRTRRRIGADGAAEIEPGASNTGAGEPDEGESAGAPAADHDAPAEAEVEKPKKKKRKKEKSAKKAKSEAGLDVKSEGSDGSEGAEAAGESSVSSTEEAAPAAEKPKKSRRKRVEQATPDAVEAERAEAAPVDAPVGAPDDGAPSKPERRKRKKAVKAVEAVEAVPSDETASKDEPSEPVERKHVADDSEPAQPAKAKARGKRRRVVVVPRSEDELPAQAPVEFGEAADIREFADDMDDVFDGVDFEPDAADDAPKSADAKE
ncbi:hypothetical protein C5B85_00450 [Pseudoclavibacter sp. AY1F1]|uniref:DUF3027 domain-containing protein n=1 Tax=Pseudoclavibacter sp. AY1F1 TaxID=2080583 RepID=UPI000CE73F1F|nr:DUF3027 domain-containing protein [Pseudoclavibacter sp. AY1F1]PPF46800.1 hypothetical protein C5B85_00450 [Pseudoclavibacter sp. AY1F1]